MNAFLRLFWKTSQRKKAIHSRYNGYLYFLGQFFLFGLIGTAIDVNNTDTDALKDVLIVIFVALLGRVLAVFLVLSCCEGIPDHGRVRRRISRHSAGSHPFDHQGKPEVFCASKR